MRSQNQAELEKLVKLMQDTGEVRCPKPLKRLTSIDNQQIRRSETQSKLAKRFISIRIREGLNVHVHKER